MNNEDFYSADFTNSLPPTLKNDPDMMALAQTISAQLQTTAAEVRKNIIYARIDELDEATLDVLAYDLHVDWYDYSYPIEVKRRTIRDSIQVHRRLGTKYAVEKALGAVYPGTKVEEWFEYGGQPYWFKIQTSATLTKDGMLYFLKHVDCNAVFPMHYWNEPSVIDRFITEYPQYKSRIKNTESAKGEEI